MSTPSEHAMKFALKYYRDVATVFEETVPDDDPHATKFACEIDTHAIAPAVAERDRRIAELVADKERLDWLEQQGKPESFEDAPHSTVWVLIGNEGQRALRDAIDAARAQQNPTTP